MWTRKYQEQEELIARGEIKENKYKNFRRAKDFIKRETETKIQIEDKPETKVR